MSCLLDRKISVHTVSGRAGTAQTTHGSDHDHRDVHRVDRRGRDLASPTPTDAPSWSSPTGPASPGWKDVTTAEWESAQWQRSHCVKNIRQLRELLGDLVDERFYADLERDQRERATMSMLVPPQMMNTMAPHEAPCRSGSLTEAFYADPIRHYMIPVFSDRRTDWPSHPYSSRDSLHEHDMWAAEGLTHRYPTKVLAELLPDLPAVLRPLHADGPGRQLDADRRQAEVPRQAGRPARRDAGLPAPHAVRARRRGLRRRRGQHAVGPARGIPHQGAGGREHPRHPAGHQGADGAAAALAPGRGRRGDEPGGAAWPARAASASPSTPT